MFTGKKLSVGIAFGVLLAAAFGAGCNGFFQPNTLTSIAIQPPTPTVQVGQSVSLQAWGTYQDNSRNQITSGLSWSSSDPDTITIDPNTGLMTGVSGTQGGTATITAAAQGLSATANATSFLQNVTNFQVCLGTFNSGTCPAPTWNTPGTNSGTNFYARANSGSQTIDVTTVSTWTITTPSAGTFTCVSTTSPAVCTPTGVPVGPYVLTVTYINGSPSASVNINVTN